MCKRVVLAVVVGLAGVAAPAMAQAEKGKQPVETTPRVDKPTKKTGDGQDPKTVERNDAKLGEPAQEPAKGLVEFPHPLITEVYFAVGPGMGGDASGDGEREANGDEFVELVNPHDKPIQLKGYTISAKGPRPRAAGESSAKDTESAKGNQKGKDSGKGKSGGRDGGKGKAPADGESGKTGERGGDKGDFRQVKFVFPDCELKPGQVVVVFNGHGAKWEGDVGDSSRAPKGGNDKFGGALVFTMRVPSERTGFSNRADYVMLTDPKGKAVETVAWGEIEPPKDAGRVETLPVMNGESVQRRSLTGGFEASGDTKFSPGVGPK